jgi:hypothetical protein
MVQVVSILDVMIKLGDTVFQSRDVRGAVWSGVLELDSRASGVSLADDGSLAPGLLVIELLVVAAASEGNDHRRRWSPDVASRSVDCFWDEGGSHRSLVTGYECVASAIFVNSRPCLGPPCDWTSGGAVVTWASRIWI